MVKKLWFFAVKSIAAAIIAIVVAGVFRMSDLSLVQVVATFLHVDSEFILWGIIGLIAFALLFIEHWVHKIPIFKKKTPEHFDQVLRVISKCYRIVKNEKIDLPHDKDLLKNYWNELGNEFKKLFDIPEIATDKTLFQLIGNAQNRFNGVLSMANNVCFDSKKTEEAFKFGNTEIISMHLYLNESRTIIDQFVKEKEAIFKYCK